jgi:hypothetical protein
MTSKPPRTGRQWRVAFNPHAMKNALPENFHFPALNPEKHCTTANESRKSAKADYRGAVVCNGFWFVVRKLKKRAHASSTLRIQVE